MLVHYGSKTMGRIKLTQFSVELLAGTLHHDGLLADDLASLL
jgi:hypothetical protein